MIRKVFYEEFDRIYRKSFEDVIVVIPADGGCLSSLEESRQRELKESSAC